MFGLKMANGETKVKRFNNLMIQKAAKSVYRMHNSNLYLKGSE